VKLRRFELISAGLFLACWIVFLLDFVGVLDLAGDRPLGFYPIYGLSGFLGSIAGNVFAYRLRRLPDGELRRLLLLYVAAPPGLVLLVRSFASHAEQQASPLVPFLAIAIYGIFFSVPLVVRTR
jgi:hypothetical protein